MTALLVFTSALLANGADKPEPALSPAEHVNYVVARTKHAMGGAKRLQNLKNVRLVADWTEGGQGFRGDYRATRDGRMRIDVFIDGKRVFSEGLDRTGAWEQAGEGAPVKVAGNSAAEALMHGNSYRFDGVWFARERGNSLNWSGRETVGGVDYQVVELGFPDGFKTYMYVNPANWMIERQRDTRAYHPSNDSTKKLIEAVQGDFVPLCGVPFARSSKDVDLSSGKVLTVRQVTSSSCNLPEPKLEIGRPA